MIVPHTFELTVCRCERCGHQWVPSETVEKGKLVQPMPLACASCKSAYWNLPKKKG